MTTSSTGDDEITRFEVIDEQGRIYTRWDCAIQLSRQDRGRTLKVFVAARLPPEETHG